jgi:hypothetical protein
LYPTHQTGKATLFSSIIGECKLVQFLKKSIWPLKLKMHMPSDPEFLLLVVHPFGKMYTCVHAGSSHGSCVAEEGTD